MDTERANPLVSIVTPSLNPGERLSACIESVADQTHARVEHIIVDGGSTDGTQDLLRRSEGLRWISEPDRGQSDAINKGFRIAEGRYLSWLGADDLLDAAAAERAVAAFERSTEVGWVYGDVLIDNRGEVTTMHPPEAATTADLDFDITIPSPGTFFADWALRRVGPVDESLDLVMDIDLFIRLLREGIRPARVEGVQARFIVHEGSKSGTADRGDFLEEMHRVYLKHGMRRQAGVALIRSERSRSYARIESLLAARRFADAAEAAAVELRFMYPVFARHRLSFVLTSRFPRLMCLVKRLLRRF